MMQRRRQTGRYKNWSRGDKHQLALYFREGLDDGDIALKMRRRIGGVRRMRKIMGLLRQSKNRPPPRTKSLLVENYQLPAVNKDRIERILLGLRWALISLRKINGPDLDLAKLYEVYQWARYGQPLPAPVASYAGVLERASMRLSGGLCPDGEVALISLHRLIEGEQQRKRASR